MRRILAMAMNGGRAEGGPKGRTVESKDARRPNRAPLCGCISFYGHGVAPWPGLKQTGNSFEDPGDPECPVYRRRFSEATPDVSQHPELRPCRQCRPLVPSLMMKTSFRGSLPSTGDTTVSSTPSPPLPSIVAGDGPSWSTMGRKGDHEKMDLSLSDSRANLACDSLVQLTSQCAILIRRRPSAPFLVAVLRSSRLVIRDRSAMNSGELRTLLWPPHDSSHVCVPARSEQIKLYRRGDGKRTQGSRRSAPSRPLG